MAAVKDICVHFCNFPASAIRDPFCVKKSHQWEPKDASFLIVIYISRVVGCKQNAALICPAEI